MSDKAFLQHCQQWGRGLRSAHIVAQTTDKRKVHSHLLCPDGKQDTRTEARLTVELCKEAYAICLL